MLSIIDVINAWIENRSNDVILNNSFLSFITDLFSTFFEWLSKEFINLFNIISTFILDLVSLSHDSFASVGEKVVSKLFSIKSFDSSIINDNFVFFFIGIIFAVFVFKIIINVVVDIINAIISAI